MPEPPVETHRVPTTRGRKPLIGISSSEGADEVVRYFTSEADADQAVADGDASVQRALSAIGAWSDLDFDEMLASLDRIRHQSTPTPPINSDP